MFGRHRESLHVLIRNQHEESRRHQEKRDEESKRLQEKRDEEFKLFQERRDEESKRFQEKRDEKWERYLERRDEEVRAFVEEVQAHKAELHELREKAEAREEETREFNREILLRNEKVYTTVIAEMEEGRKQIQANTKAVLSVLDRLNGSDGLAA
jgi:hypothetical protein